MSTIKEEKSAFRKAKKIEIAAITPKDMADSDDKLFQSFLSQIGRASCRERVSSPV